MRTNMLFKRSSETRMPANLDSLLMDSPISGLLGNSFFSPFANNMLETADGYKLEIAVPGMKKKDLKLEVADGVLTVQGQKQQKDTFGWARKTVEYKSTQLFKSFTLPIDADTDRIKAKCRDGLLKISIPKIKSRTAQTILIEPVATEGNSGWWQKLTRSFKKLMADIKSFLSV